MNNKIVPPYTNFFEGIPQSLYNLNNELCRHFQVDHSLVIPALLGTFSALVHDKFKVEVRDHVTGGAFVEPLSLFCIGIAGSSERKSPLLKWLVKPINDIVSRKNKSLEPSRIKQECERKVIELDIKKLRKKIQIFPKDSPGRMDIISQLAEFETLLQQPLIEPQRLFLQDTTAIAAAEFMQKQKNSSLMIMDAEGSSFDCILSDHKLLELLLSGFSNEKISFERSSRPSVEVDSPHAGLCILTQEVKLHNLAKKTSTWDEGFVPRSLIFLAQEMSGSRSTAIGANISDYFSMLWQDTCEYYLEQQYTIFKKDDYVILTLSDEATYVWRNFLGKLETMMQKHTATYVLRSWLGKMGGVVARIASLYHLFEERNHGIRKPISELYMLQACSLIEKLIPHIQEVHKLYFSQNDEVTNAIHKIVNWIKQEANTIDYFHLREMYRELNIPSKVAHAACGHLCYIGVFYQNAIPCYNKSGRRSTPIYNINYYNFNQQFPLYQY